MNSCCQSARINSRRDVDVLNVDRRRFNVPPTRLFLGYLTRCIARRPMCCARCVILMTLFNNITVYDGYRQSYL